MLELNVSKIAYLKKKIERCKIRLTLKVIDDLPFKIFIYISAFVLYIFLPWDKENYSFISYYFYS